MSASLYRSFAVLAILLPAIPAVGQFDVMPPANTCKAEPSQHEPYTVEFRLIEAKPQADGTLITYRNSEVEALDSHGRTLLSDTSPSVSGKNPSWVTGGACDPVNNTQTIWNSAVHRAVVLNMPKPDERKGCWQSSAGDFSIRFENLIRQDKDGQRSTGKDAEAPGSPSPAIDPPRAISEDLGTAMFQGVEAHGYRSTWPPVADDKTVPPYLTEEHWVATSLGIWISQEVVYPQKIGWTMKWSKELASLDLTNPAPSTFQPPEGYDIVTEDMHQVACSQLAAAPSQRQPRLH